MFIDYVINKTSSKQQAISHVLGELEVMPRLSTAGGSASLTPNVVQVSTWMTIIEWKKLNNNHRVKKKNFCLNFLLIFMSRIKSQFGGNMTLSPHKHFRTSFFKRKWACIHWLSWAIVCSSNNGLYQSVSNTRSWVSFTLLKLRTPKNIYRERYIYMDIDRYI